MDVLTIILTTVLAFAVTSFLGIWMIPYLHKIKFGQTIIDIGPTWHAKKQGTPTMGGIMFIAGIVLAATAGYMFYRGNTVTPPDGNETLRFFAGIIMSLLFGLMGFVDDYIKVVKKRNLGLRAYQKLVVQFVIAGAYLAMLHYSGMNSTALKLPFLPDLQLGALYYPLMLLFIVFFVNAVNLTDGIDGLASSVTFFAASCFMIISTLFANFGMNLLAAACAGGMVGFLLWNYHPAKVFMGDTGSMFLGGTVVALGFGLGIPGYLIPIGIIYIAEAGSVVLQVISFKLTRKRIFKMSPIHHHFEMSGYSETKIVVSFSMVTVAFAVIAIFAAMRIA